MRDAIRAAGYYELPVPIVVADDVLGTVCWTRIGTVPAQVHTPLLTSDDGESPALPPQLPGIRTGQPRLASPSDWVMTVKDNAERGASLLRRVGVVLEEPTEQQPRLSVGHGPQATRLGMAALDGMNEWAERLRTWIEVLTGQDLDHHHPRYHVSYLGAGLWISDELVPHIEIDQLEPIDRTRWRSALERIGNQQEPPLEHVLARDARTAFRRGDRRRAAIDAGTTTEIVLGRLYAASNQAQPVKNLAQPVKNLASLRNALLQLDVPLAVTPQALDALIRVRDDAAHGGQEPGADRMRDILATMTKVLAAHGSDPL